MARSWSARLTSKLESAGWFLHAPRFIHEAQEYAEANFLLIGAAAAVTVTAITARVAGCVESPFHCRNIEIPFRRSASILEYVGSAGTILKYSILRTPLSG